MRAAETYGNSGSKFGKIAIVTAFHLVAGMALFNMKAMIPSTPVPPIITLDPVPEAPKPKAEEPVIEKPKFEQPDLPIIPKTEIEIDPPPAKDIIRVREEDGPVTPPKPGAKIGGEPSIEGGGATDTQEKRVFSAALANAKDCVLPQYPKTAARDGSEGTVNLALLIGTDGRVSEAKVQRSSGFRELDRAAVAALSMCKFKPASTNGVAEPAWGQIAYVWRLD